MDRISICKSVVMIMWFCEVIMVIKNDVFIELIKGKWFLFGIEINLFLLLEFFGSFYSIFIM